MTLLRLKLGASGERRAEKYLRAKGFRLAAKNLRRRAGELDIVMWDGDDLVIVEVRTVRKLGPFSPFDRIPPSKQKQVIRVAETLLAEFAEPLPPIRFDVCIVVMEPKPEVLHYPDAFRPRW